MANWLLIALCVAVTFVVFVGGMGTFEFGALLVLYLAAFVAAKVLRRRAGA